MSDWLNTKQTAERIGTSIKTVYRLINCGDLDAYQIGRVIRVRPTDVERFLKQQRIQPGALDHLVRDKR